MALVQGTPTFTDVLFDRMRDLSTRADPDAAHAAVAARTDTEMAKFRVGAIDISTADARARVRESLATAHDDALAADLLQFAADADATARDLEGKIVKSKQPPALTNEMRAMLHLRMYEGRTLGEVVQAYQGTEDASDPTFINLVETEFQRGNIMRLFRLDESPRDVEQLQALTAAIRQRQENRADKSATQSLQFLRDLLAHNLTLTHLTTEARRGKVTVARLTRQTVAD